MKRSFKKYNKQKHISIEATYSNVEDLVLMFEDIAKRARLGVQKYRFTEQLKGYEYKLDYLQETNARIETINEQRCLVIPSKLHEI